MENSVGLLDANDTGHSISFHVQYFPLCVCVCVCVGGMEAELVLYYAKHQSSFN